MKLTRRDATAALAAAGVAVGGGAVGYSLVDDRESGPGSDSGPGPGLDSGSDSGQSSDRDDTDPPPDQADIATLAAAAEVLYPSGLQNVRAFVERYVRGRATDRPEHGRQVAAAVAYLDEYSRAWHDTGFAALETSVREEALRRMNADTADPDPEGSDVERVRYYVVDELLYALYTTPTGGELVGLENPQGHPGGLRSYQRGPR